MPTIEQWNGAERHLLHDRVCKACEQIRFLRTSGRNPPRYPFCSATDPWTELTPELRRGPASGCPEGKWSDDLSQIDLAAERIADLKRQDFWVYLRDRVLSDMGLPVGTDPVSLTKRQRQDFITRAHALQPFAEQRAAWIPRIDALLPSRMTRDEAGRRLGLLVERNELLPEVAAELEDRIVSRELSA